MEAKLGMNKKDCLSLTTTVYETHLTITNLLRHQN